MPRRTPLIVAAALVGAGMLVASTWSAAAQIPPLDAQPPPTTAPPTTQPPPPEQAPSQPTPGPAAPTDDGSGGGSGDAGATPGDGSTGANRIPPEYQSLVNSVRRSPANNTKALVAALSQLQQFGLTAQQAAIVGMGRFPIAGTATFGDDWWYPRFVPTFHLHVGTDIFAAYGTPIRAPVDGRVRISNGKVGGLAVYVYMPDGTYFYMAHMSALADGLTEGEHVKTGDVVGFVGDSGNAKGGAPHCHFEIHPRGGPPIDPKPYLDRFVADAKAQVPQLVDYYARLAAARQAVPAPAADAAPLPVTPAPSPAAPVAAVDAPAPTPLLWAASMGPTASALGLAEHELLAAVRSMDWSASSGTAGSDQALVRAMLAPLTPAAFDSLL
ncbi:MAG TPA: M23 family metallopeptidase [Acidimicrobiales bacterium]|nr:M23 family metallopeptidase [Acidimicrobiales bacterium]